MQDKHEQNTGREFMTPETMTTRTRQAFYGWFALAGASLQQIVGAGAFLARQPKLPRPDSHYLSDV